MKREAVYRMLSVVGIAAVMLGYREYKDYRDHQNFLNNIQKAKSNETLSSQKNESEFGSKEVKNIEGNNTLLTQVQSTNSGDGTNINGGDLDTLNYKAEVTVLEAYAEFQFSGENDQITILFKVNIEHTGSDRKWGVNSRDFTLSDEHGETSLEHDYSRVIDGEREKNLDLISLLPGQSATGWIGFDANRSHKYTLSYEYDGQYIQFPIEFPEMDGTQSIDVSLSKTIKYIP
ncbi:hypothetical protein M2444_005381 [Paenibacillus sp. PastF-3]|uniref:DUF4352 domain-containing protein n=1 Tax=Paenibacillus sp. PastF-3 TaxID=2940626 RepID=UPI002476A97E|nr:DUF4352 domain-containing protein [Paenibacillus sp. PastF-3]MDH6373549.1 hypothetical protein [Paenibacillus sp. PastF-3]